MNTPEWDYIVVGAGSSGCALTEELVKAGKRVLLLEAGGRDRSPFIKIPAGQLKAMAKHDWGYQSEPDPSRGGAAENWARGRVLGGSSSVNGTMYTRGVPADYDRWNVPGWSWQDVLPIFLDFENSDQPGPLRGHEGPLHIRTIKRPHALTRAFVESARAVNPAINAVIDTLPDWEREVERTSLGGTFGGVPFLIKNLVLRAQGVVTDGASRMLAGVAASTDSNDSRHDVHSWYREVFAHCPFTGLYNLTGLPAMSLPLCTTERGLPIGIQLVGRYGDEATLFSLAAQLEQVMPWESRVPPIHVSHNDQVMT